MSSSGNFGRSARSIGVGVFVLTVLMFFRVPLVADMARDFRLSALAVGGLSSAFALGRLLADMPAGRATDRYAAGPMLAVAALVVAAGSAVMAISPTVAVLFTGSFVLGVGSASMLTASFAFYSMAPRERRGHYLSLFAAAMLVGQAIGPAVGGPVATAADWRWTLAIAAVGAVFVGLAFSRMSTSGPSPQEAAGSGAPSAAAQSSLVLWTIYLLPAVQFGVGASLYQTLLPLVAAEELGFPTALIGLGLGLGGVARFVAALVAGFVADHMARKAALVPGLVLQLGGVAVFGLVDSAAGWWWTVLLLTLGSVIVNVGSAMLADLSEGGPLGARLGRFRFTGDAAFLVAPVITGALFQAFGRVVSMTPLFVFTAAVTIAAATILPETLHAPDGEG